MNTCKWLLGALLLFTAVLWAHDEDEWLGQVLTVEADAKRFRNKFGINAQVLGHKKKIGLLNRKLAAVDKAGVYTLPSQIPLKGESACKGIRVGIVVTLDNYIFKIFKI